MDGSQDRKSPNENSREKIDHLKDRIEVLEILIHSDWPDR